MQINGPTEFWDNRTPCSVQTFLCSGDKYPISKPLQDLDVLPRLLLTSGDENNIFSPLFAASCYIAVGAPGDAELISWIGWMSFHQQQATAANYFSRFWVSFGSLVDNNCNWRSFPAILAEDSRCHVSVVFHIKLKRERVKPL